MNNKKTQIETIKLHTEKLVEKVNELAREGNVRRVTIKDKHGKQLLTFPMTLGVAAAVIAPILASIGLIAFFITECRVVVTRKP